MKKVSLCILLNQSHYQTIYCFERIGFNVAEKETEFINKDKPKEYVNKIYGVEIELIVGYTKETQQRTIDYFKPIANKLVDVTNLTKYQAYNKLFLQAEYDYVCVYQPDCIVQKNWLLELVFYCQAVYQSGIVSICEIINEVECYSLVGEEQEEWHNVYAHKSDVISNESVYLFNKEYLYLIGGFDNTIDLYGNEFKQLQTRYALNYYNNFYIPTQSIIIFESGYTYDEEKLKIGNQNHEVSISSMLKNKSFYIPIN